MIKDKKLIKVGIMQPYLFPYIGYWQLIYAVDKFVLLDDVNFIKRGYINRNNILINESVNRFTIPVQNASQNRLICEIKLSFTKEDKLKFLKTLEMAYKKAPYFDETMEVIKRVIMNKNDDLTSYISNSIEMINEYLEIKTAIYRSSQIKKNNSLHAEERIVEICKKMEADIYINPPGGRKLYSHERFEKEKIKLFFIDPAINEIQYEQFSADFVNNLSIIDIMMFNQVHEIKKFLNMYELNIN